MFWLDLPSPAERERIFDVLLKRYNRDSAKYNLKKLADKAVDFTGAEIEQTIIGAMYTRFDRDGKEFTNTDLEDEINATKPLAVTSKEDIDNMRAKAVNKLRAVSSAGSARMFARANETQRSDNTDTNRELDIS